MKLNKFDYQEKTTENSRYECTDYTLGHYLVSHYIATYTDGDVRERFVISGHSRYLPEIYFEDGCFGEEKRFEIQTRAYGTMTVDKIKEVVAGYQRAIEAVEILTKEFLK